MNKKTDEEKEMLEKQHQKYKEDNICLAGGHKDREKPPDFPMENQIGVETQILKIEGPSRHDIQHSANPI